MTAYCDVDDVKREMGRYGPNLTNVSVPSLQDAEAMIATISSEIDGVLAGKGIQVPVSVPPNDASLAPWVQGFLKRLNAMGAAGVVLQGMFPHATGPASSSFGDDKTKEYRAILDDLMTKEGMIPSSIVFVGSSRQSARSLWTDGNVSADDPGSVDPEMGPLFTRTTVW